MTEKAALGIERSAILDGSAVFRFSDLSRLILIPYRNWGNIEGFDASVLYADDKLAALAIDRPSRYSAPEDSGFWAERKEITQERLAGYMEAARLKGREAYSLYDKKRMPESEWLDKGLYLWKITSVSGLLLDRLKDGKVRQFDKNPEKYKLVMEPLSVYRI